jgi:hypothetical protein
MKKILVWYFLNGMVECIACGYVAQTKLTAAWRWISIVMYFRICMVKYPGSTISALQVFNSFVVTIVSEAEKCYYVQSNSNGHTTTSLQEMLE